MAYSHRCNRHKDSDAWIPTVLIPMCCSPVWICFERYSYCLSSTFVGQVNNRGLGMNTHGNLCGGESQESQQDLQFTGEMGTWGPPNL